MILTSYFPPSAVSGSMKTMVIAEGTACVLRLGMVYDFTRGVIRLVCAYAEDCVLHCNCNLID